ncbi:hypothetical protein [Candidatus Ruminimicrobium bovinum]|uniref:hypothetical protein n=1 Tax=Candidatus Ruminimicrobium bovinum TaxID=3242779 RepID=UPI0039B913A0
MYFKKLKYLLFFLPVFLVSCSGLNGYYSKLETLMTKEKYKDAAALVDNSQKTYGNKNRLLYYLDLGLAQHLSKKYSDSNSSFEQAKQIYSINYTKSISAGVFSLFSNDNVIPYYGQPYEMAYANVFCALNYILDGRDNEAVVEARQVDNLFKKIKADSNGKAFYNDDGFVRYFMGIVYENAGYYNDALISYKLALRYYNVNKDYAVNVPDDLICSLYTMYYKLGMSSQTEQLKTQYPNVKLINPGKNSGEVIIVNYNGLSPKKTDNILELSFYNAWPYFISTAATSPEQEKVEQVFSAVRAGVANDFIKVAFPKYVRYENEIVSFSVEESSRNISNGYLAGDIASVMEAVLKNNNTAVYAKTIARAVARYVLTKVVTDQVRQHEKKGDHTLSIITNSLLNITSSLLEKSDKRSWRTLPENINMARFVLPEGVHKLKINYLDYANRVVGTEEIEISVKANKKTFVTVNSLKLK